MSDFDLQDMGLDIVEDDTPVSEEEQAKLNEKLTLLTKTVKYPTSEDPSILNVSDDESDNSTDKQSRGGEQGHQVATESRHRGDGVNAPSSANISSSTDAKVPKHIHHDTISVKRIKVRNPEQTKLFHGNPRNFGPKPNVGELTSLIEGTDGNLVPVMGFIDWQGDLCIIAGSQRRQACINAKKPLTIDLYDLDEEGALLLADHENRGRSDITYVGLSNYYYWLFQRRLKATKELTTKEFAIENNKSRQTMQEYFSFAELPEWVKMVDAGGETYTHNSAQKIRSLVNKVKAEPGQWSYVQSHFIEKRFKSIEAFITEFKNISRVTGLKEKEVHEYKNEQGKTLGKVTRKPSGAMTLTFSHLIPAEKRQALDDHLAKIEKILAGISKG